MKRGQRRKERRGSSVVLEARNRDRRRSDCECNREGQKKYLPWSRDMRTSLYEIEC